LLCCGRMRRLNEADRPAAAPDVRVGLLGAGGIAQVHASALQAVSGARLVGVSDIDLVRARRLARPYDIPCFGSLAEMLEKAQPEVVHILLPPELHARFALECMAAGKHVFVEKPLCVSEAECRELETAANRFGRIVGVNHNMTFHPAFRQLLDVIRQRRLGQVQHLSVFWNVPFGTATFNAPLYAREGAGAVILETGPHPLSLLVRLMGEVRSASTLVTSHMPGLPDTWLTSLACERGSAQCFIGIGRDFTDTRVQVIGEDGCAVADLRLGYVAATENTRFSPRLFQLADSLELAGSIASSVGRGFVQRMLRIPKGGPTHDSALVMESSISNFYQALRNDREPSSSLSEGLAVVRSCLRVIEAGQRTAAPTEEEPCQAAM
jgi:predicted dehydrogenase